MKTKIRKILKRIIVGHPDSTRAAKILHAAAALVLILFVCLFGLAEYSTRPSFCNSCHIMEPYYQSWATSSHKNVPCVDCHYPPDIRGTVWVKYQALSQLAKYVTRTYGTKPYAEIEDASCLRGGCHDTRLLAGRVTFHGVVFDHAPHLMEMRRQKQLRCTSCHSQVAIGDHMTATKEACFLCHFKNPEHMERQKLAECTLCHADVPEVVEHNGGAFDHASFAGRGIKCAKCHGGMSVGDGKVEKTKCLNCHTEPERLEFYGQDIVLHRKHVTEHKVPCAHCHAEIRHERAATTRAFDASCGNCHSQMHNAPQMLYTGTGAKGVPDMPSPKFLADVDCVACHFARPSAHNGHALGGHTSVATEAACRGCHGDMMDGMLDYWKETTDEALASAQKALRMAEAAYTRAEGRGGAKHGKNFDAAGRALEAARFNLNLVREGRGVHNVDYAAAVLAHVEEDSRKCVGLLESRGEGNK